MTLDWFTWLYRILDSICADTREEKRNTDKPANKEVAFKITEVVKVWRSLPLPDP